MQITEQRKKELLLAVAIAFEQNQPLNMAWQARHSTSLAELMWLRAEIGRVLREAAER